MKPPPLTLVNYLQDLDTRMRRQERRMQGILSVEETSVLAVQGMDEIPATAPEGAIFLIASTLMVVQKRGGVLVREDELGPLTVRAAQDWSP